jgi:hypothetical protein
MRGLKAFRLAGAIRPWAQLLRRALTFVLDVTSTLRCRKMFHPCGSATLSSSESPSNVREGRDDRPSAALPLLSRDG